MRESGMATNLLESELRDTDALVLEARGVPKGGDR
jgi:hypothetical protein